MGQKRLTGDFAPVTVISENRKDDRKAICKIWNGAESADRDDLERCGGNGTE